MYEVIIVISKYHIYMKYYVLYLILIIIEISIILMKYEKLDMKSQGETSTPHAPRLTAVGEKHRSVPKYREKPRLGQRLGVDG